MHSSPGGVPHRTTASRRLKKKAARRLDKRPGRFALIGPEVLEERRLLSLSLPGVGSAGSYVDSSSGASAIVSDEIIVALQSGLQPADVFGEKMTDFHRLSGTDGQYVVSFGDFSGEEILSYVRELSGTDGVLWAAPNYYHRIQTTSIPNDPLFSMQWTLQNTGENGYLPDADADLPGAWDVTTGSSDVVIAVLDNGVDMVHPDLAANIFTNTGEIAGNGLDDDGNGWIDDVHGWDFVDHDANASPATAFDNHGTAVAGVAAAAGNNGVGVTGAAPHAQIMPLKISKQTAQDNPGFATTEDIAEAIYYAAGRTADGGTWQGADVLVISWNLAVEDYAVTAALDWAEANGRGGAGTPVFCAAGNDASGYREYSVQITEPGTWTFDWVVSVDGASPAIDPAEYKAYLAEVSFPETVAVQRFSNGQLPANWTTYADGQPGSGAWSVSNDPVYLYGTSAYAAKSGVPAAAGATHLSSPQISVAEGGTLKFEAWFETSADFPDNGHFVLRAYKDGVLVPSCCRTISPSTDVQTSVAYPASLSSTIAVGASTDCDYRADYSEYGPELDVVAPSSGGTANVTTTDRTGAQGYNTFSGTAGNYLTSFGGTSAAAPLAAGIGALLLSVNPALTADEVRQLLRTTADKIGPVPYPDSPDGTVGPYSSNEFYGYGRVNAEAAVRAATGSSPWLILQMTDGSSEVVEGGASDRYALALNGPPTADVTVELHPDAQVLAVDEAHPDRNYLTFTPGNWNVPQWVTVMAVDDRVVKSSPYYGLITHTTDSADPRYNALPVLETTVAIADNDGEACTVGDRVFADLDRDGVQDSFEPGYAGVQVALVWTGPDGLANTADDGVAGTATTGGNGLYAFHDLSAGAYFLQYQLPVYPSGLAFSAADQGDSDNYDSDVNPATGQTGVFILNSGAFDLSHDAGVTYPGATAGDRVWNDLNGNGLQEAGEPGFGGVAVVLHYSANGTVGDGDDVVVQTTVSDADGRYRFTGLNAGLNYYLTFQLPPSASLAFSSQGAGVFPDADSDVNGEGRTSLFSVTADQANLSLDAGVIESAPFHGSWVRDGGGSVSSGIDAVIDDDGNAFFLGTVTGTADLDPGPGTLPVSSADPDAPFLAVYSSEGTPYWAAVLGRRLTVDTTLQAAALVRTAEGNLIVGGTFRGTFDADPGSGVLSLTSADPAGFIVRYDAYGHFLNAFVLGSGGECNLNQAAVSSDGKLLVAGTFSGTVDFDPGAGESSLTAEGGSDAFIAKYERSGSLIWKASFGGPETNDLGVQGLAAAPDGGAWLTGGFHDAADLMPGPNTQNVVSVGENDIYLLKVSASGEGVWAARLGGSGEDGGGGLAVDTAGNLYVAGRFTGTVFFDPQGLTGNLIGVGLQNFTAKYSPDGILSWAQHSRGEHVAVDSRGNVYCAGTALTKFDTAGNFLWEASSPQANAVAASASGAVLEVGTFSGSCDFDPGAGESLFQAPEAGGFFLRKIVSAPVGDRIWMDDNGNGLQDPGETGRAGVSVDLYSSANLIVGDADDVLAGSTVSDDQGRYYFNKVQTGSRYYVRFHFVPGADDPTLGFAPLHAGGDGTRDCDVDGLGRSEMFTLSAGQTAINIDAGLTETSVTGRLWEDLNGDGILDPDEPGMSNGRVELYAANGTKQNTTYTDEDGYYAFQHYLYLSGNYYLVFSKPQPTANCYAFTTSGGDSDADASGRTLPFAVAGGNHITGIDAGLVETNVGDRVWEDLDGNGRQDAGEPGFMGAVVKLYSAGSSNVQATATTAADGSYRFTNYLFIPGDYYVTFSPPQNGQSYAFTAPDVGGDDLDSDADATGRTATFHVGRGDIATSIDAGLVETSVGDRVWEDIDGDGRQDEGEPGLGGAVVKLYSAGSSNEQATATTAADGSYRFANHLFIPGDFYVVFSPPQNGKSYAFAAPNAASDDLDSDADATGQSAAFHVGRGDTLSSIDAGLVETGISGRVWDDADGDSLQSVGELGVGGITVELHSAADDSLLRSVTTDAAGSYDFANYLFQAGNYYLVFKPANGKSYSFTSANAGDDSLDSDVDPQGRTAIFPLSVGTIISHLDAGVHETSLEGRIWRDTDADGIRETGEVPQSGVKVELFRIGGPDEPPESTAYSGGDGRYHFANYVFLPGDYFLVFTAPPDNRFSPAHAGTDDTLDSDVDPSTNRGPVITVSPGLIENSLDAGLIYEAPVTGEIHDVGSTGLDEGRAVATDLITGDALIVGRFSGTIDFSPGHSGTGQLVSHGQTDIFISKYSSSGVFLWAKSFGGPGDDAAFHVAVGPQGDIYLTGSFSGTMDLAPDDPALGELVSHGGKDLFIARFDKEGNLTWAKSYGGAEDDEGLSVALDALGNVYVGGDFRDTVQFGISPNVLTLSSAGGTDGFVGCWDGQGLFQWARSLGGGAGDVVKSVAVSGTSLAAGGRFEGTAHFNPGNASADRISVGADDGFILWLDTAGGWHDVFTLGNTGEDSVNALAADNQGNIYVTGGFREMVDFDPGLGSRRLTSTRDAEDNFTGDVFVASYSPAHTLLWAKAIGGAGEDHANAICLDFENAVYLIGLYEQTVDFNPDPDAALERTSRGEGDLFAVKLDSLGNFRFVRTLGGDLKEEGFGIAVNNAQQMFTTGFFLSQSVYLDDDTSNPFGDNTGDEDVVISVYNTPCKASGKVWNDSNKNGVFEPNEIPLLGFLVQLFQFVQESPPDPGQYVQIKQLSVGGNGLYSFWPLDVGSYYVKVVLPEGYAFTDCQVPGVGDGFNSDFDPFSGETAPFQITSYGQSVPNLDAGIYPDNVNRPPVVTESPALLPPTSHIPVTDNLHHFVLDPDQDPLVLFEVIRGTNWGSLTLTSTTGEFTYEPDNYFYGTDSFRYRATDYRGGSVEGEIVFTVDDTVPGVIMGGAGDDVIRIVRNAANPNRADVFVNNSTAQPSFSAYFSSFYQWQISSGGGADRLIIDLSQGNPLPVSGLYFDGGSFTSNAQLILRGGDADDDVTLTFSSIDVYGIPPILYSGVTYFGFEMGGGNDSLTLDNATLNTPGDEALSDGLALTLRNDSFLDLCGHTETVASVCLEGGKIENGTLHAAQYDLQSGVLSVLLAPAVSIDKTTLDEVRVSGGMVAQSLSVREGNLSVSSITAGTLTIGGSSGSAPEQSGDPPAAPAASSSDDAAGLCLSPDTAASRSDPSPSRPAAPLETEFVRQDRRAEPGVSPEPLKPFDPAASSRTLDGVSEITFYVMPTSGPASNVLASSTQYPALPGKTVQPPETDAAILSWLAGFSLQRDPLLDRRAENVGANHAATESGLLPEADARKMPKTWTEPTDRSLAGLPAIDRETWIRCLRAALEQENSDDTETEESSWEPALLFTQTKESGKSRLRAIDYCHAEARKGGDREIT